MHKKFQEGKLLLPCIAFSKKMNDMSSDSENDNLSMEVDITGSSKSVESSKSIDHTADLAGQAGGTSDNLSSISDIPTPRGWPVPT